MNSMQHDFLLVIEFILKVCPMILTIKNTHNAIVIRRQLEMGEDDLTPQLLDNVNHLNQASDNFRKI
jgi:hypothetical protein